LNGGELVTFNSKVTVPDVLEVSAIAVGLTATQVAVAHEVTGWDLTEAGRGARGFVEELNRARKVRTRTANVGVRDLEVSVFDPLFSQAEAGRRVSAF
jgi:hypothetical protein